MWVWVGAYLMHWPGHRGQAKKGLDLGIWLTQSLNWLVLGLVCLQLTVAGAQKCQFFFQTGWKFVKQRAQKNPNFKDWIQEKGRPHKEYKFFERAGSWSKRLAHE